MRCLAGLVVAVALTSTSFATVIDDFQTNDLANYTSTVILQNGVNTASWQMGSGALTYTTTSYSNVNQVALIRNGLTLAVGEELQAPVNRNSGTQDLGLYVGGVQPVTGTRSTYVSVYGRDANQVYSRGFNGTTELPLAGTTGAAGWDTLFITRTALNDYELGYYAGPTRTVLTTRTGMTNNDATYVGVYADIRSAATLGTMTSISVVPEPTTASLAGAAAIGGLMLRRRGGRRA